MKYHISLFTYLFLFCFGISNIHSNDRQPLRSEDRQKIKQLSSDFQQLSGKKLDEITGDDGVSYLFSLISLFKEIVRLNKVYYQKEEILSLIKKNNLLQNKFIDFLNKNSDLRKNIFEILVKGNEITNDQPLLEYVKNKIIEEDKKETPHAFIYVFYHKLLKILQIIYAHKKDFMKNQKVLFAEIDQKTRKHFGLWNEANLFLSRTEDKIIDMSSMSIYELNDLSREKYKEISILHLIDENIRLLGNIHVLKYEQFITDDLKERIAFAENKLQKNITHITKKIPKGYKQRLKFTLGEFFKAKINKKLKKKKRYLLNYARRILRLAQRKNKRENENVKKLELLLKKQDKDSDIQQIKKILIPIEKLLSIKKNIREEFRNRGENTAFVLDIVFKKQLTEIDLDDNQKKSLKDALTYAGLKQKDVENIFTLPILPKTKSTTPTSSQTISPQTIQENGNGKLDKSDSKLYDDTSDKEQLWFTNKNIAYALLIASALATTGYAYKKGVTREDIRDFIKYSILRQYESLDSEGLETVVNILYDNFLQQQSIKSYHALEKKIARKYHPHTRDAIKEKISFRILDDETFYTKNQQRSTAISDEEIHTIALNLYKRLHLFPKATYDTLEKKVFENYHPNVQKRIREKITMFNIEERKR